MTEPKSFEWRGYVFGWRPDAKRGDYWVVFPPGSHRPIGVADSEPEAKELVRGHVRQQIAEAQAEYDRVMEPDGVIPVGDQPVPRGYVLGPDGVEEAVTIAWTMHDRATSSAKVCSMRLVALGFSWEVYRAGRLIAEGRARDHLGARVCAETAAMGAVN